MFIPDWAILTVTHLLAFAVGMLVTFVVLYRAARKSWVKPESTEPSIAEYLVDDK